jgi:hypothetical protein
VPRVTGIANRWLLFLLAAFACLALPAAAGGATSVTGASGVSLTPVLQGTPGSNGWYVSNVVVGWQFDPNPPTKVQGCFIGAITAEGVTHLDCKAWWGLSSAEVVLDVSIDKTAPAVHAVPSRGPDANGWYNKPVTFTFGGSDATSGIASCSSTSYSGPDSGKASVAGTCTDKAGNVGHAVYRFSYDSTPPALGSLSAEHGNRSVVLRWKESAGTQAAEVARSGSGSHKIVYQGSGTEVRDEGLRVGAKYKYTITAVDQAGNTSHATLAVTATGPLTSPVPGQKVASRPHLTWLPAKGASYYNVSLYRGGRILSLWPKRTSVTLPLSWTYQGHRHRLRNGSYRWYVWPGYGKKAQARYGKLLGSDSFVYTR